MINSPDLTEVFHEFNYSNWHLDNALKAGIISHEKHHEEFLSLIENRKSKIFHLLKKGTKQA